MIDAGAEEAKRRHPKIKWWDDERDRGDSLLVTLKEGWAFYDNVPEQHRGQGQGCHVQGFDTIAEAMRQVRQAAPCHCERCTDES